VRGDGAHALLPLGLDWWPLRVGPITPACSSLCVSQLGQPDGRHDLGKGVTDLDDCWWLDYRTRWLDYYMTMWAVCYQKWLSVFGQVRVMRPVPCISRAHRCQLGSPGTTMHPHYTPPAFALSPGATSSVLLAGQ
jgi:hypothetical protein